MLKQSNKDKELVFITKRNVNTSPELSSTRGKSTSAISIASRVGTASNREELRMIEMQREEIKRLRKRATELEGIQMSSFKVNFIAFAVSASKRPLSRGGTASTMEQKLPQLTQSFQELDGTVS